MRKIYKLFFLFLLICISSPLTLAGNKPRILSFSKWQYKGENKNWSIGQDERGTVYFGNDIGLLEFDGVEWKLNKYKNSATIRSVLVVSHNEIYTGSYEDFGVWRRDSKGDLQYKSLSDKISRKLIKNSDFWRICRLHNKIYFQSFNAIFVYDYKTIKKINIFKPVLLLAKIRDELWIQGMQDVIYRIFPNDKVNELKGSSFFRKYDVRVLLPFKENSVIIGTADNGIYLYDGKSFKEWNKKLSSVLRSNELNCGILAKNGNYYFGTILNGIYETDPEGRIINHISNKSDLPNNTILSLFEDNLGNIWIGMDKGISYLKYLNNIDCYIDYHGNTGAMYDAVLWKGKLFLGTNQGLFYLPVDKLNSQDVFSNLSFIKGTEGQVWSVKVIDGKLYCCHNKGLKEIHGDLSVSEPYKVGTGVFNITKVALEGKNVLLLSTYSSIRLIYNRKMYDYSKFYNDIVNNIYVDHLDNIWLQNPNQGVYRCRLSADFRRMESLNKYGGDSKDGLPYKLVLFKVGGQMMFLGNDVFYVYDDISDKMMKSGIMNNCFDKVKNIKNVIPIGNNLYWAVSSTSAYKFYFNAYKAEILEWYNIADNGMSFVNLYENISPLNNNESIICLDNGFLIYKGGFKTFMRGDIPIPFIESVLSCSPNNDNDSYFPVKKNKVKYNHNKIIFSFSAKNTFPKDILFSYSLFPENKNWSDPAKINKVVYDRLPTGKYSFYVRSVDELGHYSKPIEYDFEIMAPWYLSVWAILLYIVLFLFFLFLTWRYFIRQYQNRYLIRLRLREAKKLKLQNDSLQNKVEEKNAELFTQTSYIMQKNDLILKIKDELNSFLNRNNNKAIVPLVQKINVLLNNNMDPEKDWQTFLLKFEEKHNHFFRNLKSRYPQLTSNDLKFCACLKLNLDSKQMAKLMNVSVRAVENSRYRIRKKLNVPSNKNLNEFFIDF